LTYDKEIKEDLSVVVPEFWAGFCLQTAKHINDFYTMYLEEAKKRGVLIHFLRYEDLMGDKEKTLTDLLCFILDVDSIEGTVVEKRIKEVVGRGAEAGIVFKPKSDIHNRHTAKFQVGHLKMMGTILADYIYTFGYVAHPEKENSYGFWKHEAHLAEKLELYEKFRDLNKEHSEWGVQNADKIKDIQFNINDAAKKWELLTGPELANVLQQISIKH
jgi:hypothetical protein